VLVGIVFNVGAATWVVKISLPGRATVRVLRAHELAATVGGVSWWIGDMLLYKLPISPQHARTAHGDMAAQRSSSPLRIQRGMADTPFARCFCKQRQSARQFRALAFAHGVPARQRAAGTAARRCPHPAYPASTPALHACALSPASPP